MDNNESQVSHVDLYHKLGKLEGLMETMMASISSFQSAIKDVHTRIDSLENRQTILEQKQSANSGAASAISVAAKDFLIPVLAITVAWLVAFAETRNTAPHPPHAEQHQVEENSNNK
jgi:ABC-type Fe2+-enterobactin transport system substrate-binding protein